MILIATIIESSYMIIKRSLGLSYVQRSRSISIVIPLCQEGFFQSFHGFKKDHQMGSIRCVSIEYPSIRPLAFLLILFYHLYFSNFTTISRPARLGIGPYILQGEPPTSRVLFVFLLPRPLILTAEGIGSTAGFGR